MDAIKIQWTLQMCTRKAANWKWIQLDQAASALAEDHHYQWDAIQANFKLKWGDMHTKDKAQQCFFNRLKQTGSVCQYVEIFNKLLLKAEFKPDCYMTTAFFTSLKLEVRLFMVRKQPKKLKDLKTLVISLDKE